MYLVMSPNYQTQRIVKPRAVLMKEKRERIKLTTKMHQMELIVRKSKMAIKIKMKRKRKKSLKGCLHLIEKMKNLVLKRRRMEIINRMETRKNLRMTRRTLKTMLGNSVMMLMKILRSLFN